MKRRWYPPHDSTAYMHIQADKLPPIGSVIAFNHRALEILRYDERDDGWIAQVRRIHGPRLKSENDRAECGLRLRNFAILDVYKGRIPLCSCCGDPWPCTREIAEREARDDMRHLAGQMEKAHDGFCYSCGEPITTRQGKVLAPEANIELPGFRATRIPHTLEVPRRSCRLRPETPPTPRRPVGTPRLRPAVTQLTEGTR